MGYPSGPPLKDSRRFGFSEIVFVIALGIVLLKPWWGDIRDTYSKYSEDFFGAKSTGTGATGGEKYSLKVGSVYQRSPFCDGRAPEAYLGLSVNIVKRVYSGEVVKAIKNAHVCHEVGPAKIAFRRYFGREMYLDEQMDAEVEITEIKAVSFDSIDEGVAKAIGAPSLEYLKPVLLIESLDQAERSFQLLTFRVTKKTRRKFQRFLPPNLSFAKTVTFKEVETLLSKGATWINVQPSESFSSNHKAIAINVPYVITVPSRETTPLRVNEYENEDIFDLSKLPQDKLKPLIVSGTHAGDFRPIRALTILSSVGYKKLHWFRGGEFERLGWSRETPENPPGIQVVKPEEARQMATTPNEALFVDTRKRYEFLDRRILGAKWAQLVSPGDMGAGKVSFENYSIATLREARESFAEHELPQDKNTQLIFYGNDLADYRALKALVWAREAGWKRVAWLREGIDGWIFNEEIEPSLYRTEFGDRK